MKSDKIKVCSFCKSDDEPLALVASQIPCQYRLSGETMSRWPRFLGLAAAISYTAYDNLLIGDLSMRLD